MESSALGAVMVGVKALDLPVVIEPSVISEYEPDAEHHLLYLQQYQKFDRIYKLLKNEFSSPVIETKQVAV